MRRRPTHSPAKNPNEPVSRATDRPTHRDPSLHQNAHLPSFNNNALTSEQSPSLPSSLLCRGLFSEEEVLASFARPPPRRRRRTVSRSERRRKGEEEEEKGPHSSLRSFLGRPKSPLVRGRTPPLPQTVSAEEGRGGQDRISPSPLYSSLEMASVPTYEYTYPRDGPVPLSALSSIPLLQHQLYPPQRNEKEAKGSGESSNWEGEGGRIVSCIFELPFLLRLSLIFSLPSAARSPVRPAPSAWPIFYGSPSLLPSLRCRHIFPLSSLQKKEGKQSRPESSFLLCFMFSLRGTSGEEVPSPSQWKPQEGKEGREKLDGGEKCSGVIGRREKRSRIVMINHGALSSSYFFFTFFPLPAVCLCRHHRSEVEKLLFLSLKLLLLSFSLLPFPSLAFYACGFLAIRTSTTS